MSLTDADVETRLRAGVEELAAEMRGFEVDLARTLARGNRSRWQRRAWQSGLVAMLLVGATVTTSFVVRRNGGVTPSIRQGPAAPERASGVRVGPFVVHHVPAGLKLGVGHCDTETADDKCWDGTILDPTLNDDASREHGNNHTGLDVQVDHETAPGLAGAPESTTRIIDSVTVTILVNGFISLTCDLPGGYFLDVNTLNLPLEEVVGVATDIIEQAVSRSEPAAPAPAAKPTRTAAPPFMGPGAPVIRFGYLPAGAVRVPRASSKSGSEVYLRLPVEPQLQPLPAGVAGPQTQPAGIDVFESPGKTFHAPGADRYFGSQAGTLGGRRAMWSYPLDGFGTYRVDLTDGRHVWTLSTVNLVGSPTISLAELLRVASGLRS